MSFDLIRNEKLEMRNADEAFAYRQHLLFMLQMG